MNVDVGVLEEGVFTCSVDVLSLRAMLHSAYYIVLSYGIAFSRVHCFLLSALLFLRCAVTEAFTSHLGIRSSIRMFKHKSLNS